MANSYFEVLWIITGNTVFTSLYIRQLAHAVIKPFELTAFSVPPLFRRGTPRLPSNINEVSGHQLFTVEAPQFLKIYQRKKHGAFLPLNPSFSH